MTRSPRRATIVVAALLAAPLGFAITAGTSSAALAAAGPATQIVQSAGDIDTSLATKKSKKKKKKKTTTPVATKPVESSTLEAQVVALTNTHRTANGCGALRTDARLTAAARAHSTDMVTKNFFSHTGSDGSTFVQREARAGYTTGASAENIAWGYRTPQQVVDGWMNSAGHRANILNCGSVAVGVGVAYKVDGTPYWTQDFGRV